MTNDRAIAALFRDTASQARAASLELIAADTTHVPQARSTTFTGSTYYERVATVDGLNAASGASIVLAVGPLSPAGVAGGVDTAIVSLSIYNTTIDSQVRILGAPTPATLDATFSHKSTGTYTAELWIARQPFRKAPSVTVIAQWGTASVKMDSGTTSAPASLTASTVVNTVGSTAQRPSTVRVTGQSYFDTTLGKPITWNGTNWVDAAGATV